MLLERLRPLFAGAIAAPAGLMRRDIGQGALLERHRSCLGSPLLAFGSALGVQWVQPVQALPLGFPGFLARLLERNVLARAQSHMVLLVVDAVPEEPTARAAVGNLQIGAMANSVASRLGDFCQVFGGRIASH